MTGWRRDVSRAAVILATSTVLGLASNALSARPLQILSSEGPGVGADRAPRITPLQLKTAWAQGRALLLLDVRSDSSYAEGHSPRALHAPAPDFVLHYERLGLATVLKAADGVVVACEGGDCAAGDRVAAQLRGLGHKDVRVLQGGWEAAAHAGLESTRK
jgi:rhodanese-related sulfurtransferase